MVTAKLQINRVTIYPEGTGVVISTSNKTVNPQGVWKLTAKQMARLAGSAGCTPQQLALVKGTLVVTGENVKKGQEFTDRSTGEVRTFTKDHFRVEDLSIELNPQDKFALLGAAAMAAAFTTPAQSNSSITSIKDDTFINDNNENAHEEEENDTDFEAAKAKLLAEQKQPA